MIIGVLVVAGTVFASAAFAGNQSYSCSSSSSTMRDSASDTQCAIAAADRCPWYKRWFGIHDTGCTRNNNSSSNSNCTDRNC